ncbi:MAG: hypothetical protein ACO29O_09120 [Chitinophagaceae bacterium]
MPRILIYALVIIGMLSCKKEYSLGDPSLYGGSKVRSIQSGLDAYEMNFFYNDQTSLDSVSGSLINERFKLNFISSDYKINIGDGSQKYFVINNGRVKNYFEVLPGNDTLVIKYDYERGFNLYQKIITKHFYNGSPEVVDSITKIDFRWEGGNLISVAIRDYDPVIKFHIPKIIYYLDYYNSLAPFNFIQFNPGMDKEEFFLDRLDLGKKSSYLIKNIEIDNLETKISEVKNFSNYEKDTLGNIISVSTTSYVTYWPGKSKNPPDPSPPPEKTVDPLKKFGGTITYKY